MKRNMIIMISCILAVCLCATGCGKVVESLLQAQDEANQNRRRDEIEQELGVCFSDLTPVEEKYMIDFQGWGYYYLEFDCSEEPEGIAGNPNWSAFPASARFEEFLGKTNAPMHIDTESVQGVWFLNEHYERSRTFAVYDSAARRLTVCMEAR